VSADGRKNVSDGDAEGQGHSVREIPLDKLKALLLSKADLILSTIADSILNSVSATTGERLSLRQLRLWLSG